MANGTAHVVGYEGSDTEQSAVYWQVPLTAGASAEQIAAGVVRYALLTNTYASAEAIALGQ